MFTYKTKLRLKDTDATGVLYFVHQFNLIMEAFEEFLQGKGFSLNQLLESPILLPVVHAEADYMAPLRLGDEIEIRMELEAIGRSSLTFAYRLWDPERQIEVGRVKIVHVAMDRKTRVSVPIPDVLLQILPSPPTSQP